MESYRVNPLHGLQDPDKTLYKSDKTRWRKERRLSKMVKSLVVTSIPAPFYPPNISYAIKRLTISDKTLHWMDKVNWDTFHPKILYLDLLLFARPF